MIQINELRIGNLVLNNGLNCKVEVINNELDEVYILGEDFYYSNFCCNIDPIPLTEEWLLKFGFQTEESFCYELDNIVINTSRELMWVFTKCKNNVELELPEFVHQLQNLYFALTNNELTMKQ